eukprot:TRINITY_DN8921_c1_g1_i1.p1 TRINITY_DN8921_c1_g1~~TRINITY_DN8921_c1_g1_i1.p1  ORF type:complete len:435 (+),score=88.88 TRINITY_DN8921_c1_g1_i1:84-1388(+)
MQPASPALKPEMSPAENAPVATQPPPAAAKPLMLPAQMMWSQQLPQVPAFVCTPTAAGGAAGGGYLTPLARAVQAQQSQPQLPQLQQNALQPQSQHQQQQQQQPQQKPLQADPLSPRGRSRRSSAPAVFQTRPAAPQASASQPVATPGYAVGTASASQPVATPGFAVGTHTVQGRKRAFPGMPNQDATLVLPLGPGLLLAAVLDGHGPQGHNAAGRARSLIEQHAPTLLASLGRSSGASKLAWLFEHIHEALVAEGLARQSGTTATLAVIDTSKGTVTVAHAGDSTLMICNAKHEVDFHSRDHKIDEEVTRRVHEKGGEVRSDHGTVRIFEAGGSQPGLAMSRSLGDQEAHAIGVLYEPEICSVPLRPGGAVVLASDGLWDMVPPSEVAPALPPNGAGHDLNEAARALSQRSRERYPPEGDIDDITVVLIRPLA